MALGKVFDEKLAHLREPYVVFEPEHVTPAQLHDGWWSAVNDFYSMQSIFRRIVLRRKPLNLWINLATNLYYWSKVKRGIHTVYFGKN